MSKKLLSMKLLSIFVVVLLALTFVVGCSSDDDNNTTGPDNNNGNPTGLPDLSALAIPIPAAMQTAASSDAGAANAVGLITTLNSFASFTAFLAPNGTPKISSTNDTVITWTDGDLSITLTVATQDSMLTWTVNVTGTFGDETYDSFDLVIGSTKPDGSYGFMGIFGPGPGGSQQILAWSWNTTSTGIFSIEYVLVGEMSVDVQYFPNGSGVVRQRAGSIIVFVATWNIDGTGQYTFYDAQGTVTSQGSW